MIPQERKGKAANNTINNAKIADIIPFKEIGANSNFHGTMVVQSFEITGVENVDIKNQLKEDEMGEQLRIPYPDPLTGSK